MRPKESMLSALWMAALVSTAAFNQGTLQPSDESGPIRLLPLGSTVFLCTPRPHTSDTLPFEISEKEGHRARL